MKNRFTNKTFLFVSLALIFSGLAIFYLVDAKPLANTNDQELDRLLKNMLVLKVTHIANPIEFRLKDIDDRQVSLSDFRGKIVFLNFWTTWCPTCRIEMPSMEKLHHKMKDKDLAMVTINLQETASQVKKFFKAHKLTFTALLDSTGEVGTAFGIYQIPTTFILDKEGRIIAKALGPREWDSKDSIAMFEHLTDRYVAISDLRSMHGLQHTVHN
jgi:peroxiredoxin